MKLTEEIAAREREIARLRGEIEALKRNQVVPDGRRTVVGVVRSPLNAQQWQLELSCGHTLWLTQLFKPQRKTAVCPVCLK